MARVISAQRSTATLSSDTKSRQKDAILQCLTRLNDKATLKASAEELSAIIRSLDVDGLASLAQSICSTGAWEPKPFAKKECIKALGQLPLGTCPAADAALQPPYLGKVLGHLKKNLQDSDSLVRDAACEALASYAWALAEAANAPLQGTCSSSSPVVRVIFESLAEQKKEAQLGASQALLMIAPCIGSLDGDLVKLILRLLKSSTFQGTTALLSAVASINTEDQKPMGLLKSGASAFLPFLKHLIGHPAPRQTSTSGHDTAAAKESGLLGCLCNNNDWAVRRAAADAIRAAALLLGPQMEPHSCWQAGDVSSLTHRCLSELEERKFDKVKEAREAIKEATVVLQHLHAFVSSVGPDGDWPGWVNAHLPNAGCLTPTVCNMSYAVSPVRALSVDPTERHGAAVRTSPISKKFQLAAAQGDMVADPYSPTAVAVHEDVAHVEAASRASMSSTASEELTQEQQLQEEQQQQQLFVGNDNQMHEGFIRGAGASSTSAGHRKQSREQQQRKRQDSKSGSGAGGDAGSSRPSSAAGSLQGSRRSTAEQPIKRQNSTAAVNAGALLEARAAAAAVQPLGRSSKSGIAQQQLPSRPDKNGSSSSRPRGSQPGSAPCTTQEGEGLPWVGPTQEEWHQLKQEVEQLQQQLIEIKQQTTDQQKQQQDAMTMAVQQMQEQYSSVVVSLQERVLQLEQQQQLQAVTCEGTYTSNHAQHPSAQTGASSPSRLSYQRSSSNGCVAGAASADTSVATPASSRVPPPGVTVAAAAAVQRRSWSMSETGRADRERMYRSEDWTTPTASCARRPGLSVLETMPLEHRSCSGAPTPGSGSVTGAKDSPAPTPGKYDAAFMEALHSEKGDVHLLRLIQKTGIAWHMLSADTCQDLLRFFVKKVEEGVMLHRVVPWLWRLADEDASRPDVPYSMRQHLLQALRSCPAADDIQAQEKVSLLVQTLEVCWEGKP